jgi:hypothetical protein
VWMTTVYIEAFAAGAALPHFKRRAASDLDLARLDRRRRHTARTRHRLTLRQSILDRLITTCRRQHTKQRTTTTTTTYDSDESIAIDSLPVDSTVRSILVPANEIVAPPRSDANAPLTSTSVAVTVPPASINTAVGYHFGCFCWLSTVVEGEFRCRLLGRRLIAL